MNLSYFKYIFPLWGQSMYGHINYVLIQVSDVPGCVTSGEGGPKKVC